MRAQIKQTESKPKVNSSRHSKTGKIQKYKILPNMTRYTKVATPFKILQNKPTQDRKHNGNI